MAGDQKGPFFEFIFFCKDKPSSSESESLGQRFSKGFHLKITIKTSGLHLPLHAIPTFFRFPFG